MESETQLNPLSSDIKDTQHPVNTISSSHHVIFALVSLVFVVLTAGAVYLWQDQKVNSLNAQVNNMQATLVKDSKISLDNLEARQALPNIVIDTASSPADLIAFLGADNTQCYKSDGTGYYKVVVQANDQFAKMQYGCTAKDGTSPLGSLPSFILAKKTDSKWSLVSPTNQWLVFGRQDTPSCTMVNDNKVSKLVTPQCWQGPALGSSNDNSNQQRTVVAVTNL